MSTQNNMQQIRKFAYDLAAGAVNGQWMTLVASWNSRAYFWADEIEAHLQATGRQAPSIYLLDILGYVAREENINSWRLTSKAMALLDEPPPVSIFISYRRSVSSALAMYLWAELRLEKFSPFLDIRNIAAGDDWQSLLKNRVERSNIFISLIGRKWLHPHQELLTLDSAVVQQEIVWANANPQTRIIPVLHGGLKPDDLDKTPFAYLKTKNMILIENEVTSEMYSAVEKLKETLWLYSAG